MTRERFYQATNEHSWQEFGKLLLEQTHSEDVVKQFHTYWIVAGHHIREQIADDKALVQLLRHMLPTYTGKQMKLFRGENQERWKENKIGLAWTPNIETAKMFGRGLNSSPIGGVLLAGDFEPKAIIAGPDSHSIYLGENQFTIEPTHLVNITVIEKYSPT